MYTGELSEEVGLLRFEGKELELLLVSKPCLVCHISHK